jgi:hypothetical protein
MDRAKGFYQGLGWRMEIDSRDEDGAADDPGTLPGPACLAFFSTECAGADLWWTIDAARAELSGAARESAGSSTWMAPGASHNRHRAAKLRLASFNDWEAITGWSRRSPPASRRATSVLAAYGSVGALADALRRAAAAHDRHAKDIGHDDPDWPDWYAQYLADESAGPDMNA